MDKETAVYMSELEYIYHTLEYYPAMKKNNMAFADKWMILENIMLSETSQSQKTKGRMLFPEKWMIIYNGGCGVGGERRMEEL